MPSSHLIIAPGRVIGGAFHFTDRRAYEVKLATWADCEAIAKVQRKWKQRSNPQNRWLHGVAIKLIAEECGYDRHEREWLRYHLLGLCFGTTRNERTGQEMPKAGGTSKLSTQQFSTFMEWLVRFGATTLNLRIPLPNDPICEVISSEDEVAA
jgi:hypothetical protein